MKPGEDFGNHYHEEMEENFFVLKGMVEFVINGISHIGEKGDFFSVRSMESHYLRNVGNDEAIIAFFLAPFVDGDKVNATI